MVLRQIKVSRRKLFVSFLTVGIILLLLPESLTGNLNHLFRDVFNPVLSFGRGIKSRLVKNDVPPDYVSRRHYNSLLAECENLRSMLRQEHDRFEELARIRSNLPELNAGLVPAQVSRTIMVGSKRQLIINKGADDGVKAGQYVLGDNTVIGSIAEVSQRWSIVRLVNDSMHCMEIAIWQQNGTKEYIRGQLTGDGTEKCKIPLVSREYQIQPDSTVFAARRAGFLDVPLAVGKITKIEPDKDQPLLWSIEVAPLCRAESLTDVAVIANGP